MRHIKCIIFIIVLTIFPVQLYAVSYNAGASAWYAWGDPSFKDSFMGKEDPTSRNNKFKMTREAAFIYGILFGIQFTDDLSLGAVMSYGTGWECEADYIFTSVVDLQMFRVMDKMERMEGDLTLNYRLDNIFKIFFGWKYYGQRGEGYYDLYQLPSTYIERGTYKMGSDANGPGAGITLKLNPADNLFFITTLSGIFMKEYSGQKTKNAAGVTYSDTKDDNYTSGTNITANFTYIIPDTTVNFSLGGRYQYLVNLDAHTKNHLYGVVFSAIYAFGF